MTGADVSIDDRLRNPADGVQSYIDRFELPPDSADAPVFLLSSTWRSGSTLAQRLLVGSGSIAIWGEPFDRAAPVQALSSMLTPFSSEWPPDRYVRGATGLDPEEWIANAYPPAPSLISAIRSFLVELLAVPAARAGFDRWGLKDVRLDGGDATVLRLAFPNAKIVFLVRNPFDAWLSYRDLKHADPRRRWWHHRWPDLLVDNATTFGTLWRHATDSFLATAHDLDALLISYEDLARGAATERLAAHTGLVLDDSILEHRVGGSARRDHTEVLTVGELHDLRRAASATAHQLGYLGPSDD